MREAGISEIALSLPRTHEVMWTIIFFKKTKAITVVVAFLKAGFNKRKYSSGASNLIKSRRTNPA